MSAAPFTPRHLRFGVEMELLLKPKAALERSMKAEYGFDPEILPTPDEANTALKEVNRVALRKAIAKALTVAGLETTLLTGQYLDWTAAPERSLTEVVDKENGGGYCMLPSSSTATAWLAKPAHA